MSVGIAIFGLLLLVAVHELGHFTAAKLTGMRALRFYVGFPPAAVKRRWGDTEYGIGVIPLGGFVKIPGMLRPEPGDLYEVEDVLERNDRIDEQTATAIGVALDDVRRHLAHGRHDGALAALPRLREEVARAEPELSELQRRRVQRSLDRLAENLDPRSYWRSSRPRRLAVIVAGPAANVVACFLILWGVAITGRPDGSVLTSHVAAVIAGSPADHAGLRPDDRLIAVDGRRLAPLAVRSAIERSRGGAITVTVLRNGRRIVLGPVHTKVIEGSYRLGFSFEAGLKKYSFLEAPIASASFMWQLTTGTASALADVVTPQGRSQLHSTVGIVRYSADAASAGTPFYLTLLAYISLSLAIFNMLPFLPLDGGHVFMIALERLRGRMVSRVVFERVSVLGIALMVLVFLIGLQNDLAGILTPPAR
ncbi:MAG TPA: M50 family metallopeptidase [Gaiellales bacterium]|nr:M50 family metallopeptidase [Gaiellales bacterium]